MAEEPSERRDSGNLPPVAAPSEGARDPRMERRFLVGAVVAVSLLFFWMIRAFVVTLLLAALAAGLTFPLHRRLRARLGGRETLAAAGVVLGTFFVVVAPLTAFLGVVATQAVDVTQAVGPWVEERMEDPDALRGWRERLPFSERLGRILPDEQRLAEGASDAVRQAGRILVDGVAAAARLTGLFLLKLFIFLYAMFYFLRRGPELLALALHRIPLEPRDERLLVDRFLSVTRATLKGSLAVGALQGLLGGVAFAVVGIEGAAFWGTVMAVLSVVPGLGAPIVWVPAVAWLAATGAFGAAVGLAAWCALTVSSVDNVVRPRLVGSDTQMSDLLILLSTLGGIALFGVAGVLLGPLVAAVFVTLWNVWDRVFAADLPGEAPATEGRPTA